MLKSMDIDDLMNDTNAQLVDEGDDSMEDDLRDHHEADDEDDGHEVAGRTKEGIVEDKRNNKEEDEPNQQQKGNYSRKILTYKRLVKSIGTSLEGKTLRK